MSLELVRRLLVEVCEVAPERVTMDATLESLGVDSLMMAELLWQAEEQLGVTLDREARPATVAECVAMIEAARKG